MAIRLLEFTRLSPKPAVLYHGSPRLLELVQPHTAKALGDRKENCLKAIYASSHRHYAIPYALTIYANAEGHQSWSTVYKENEIEVVIQNGCLDLEQIGYLYHLPSETFRQIDRFQWVSDVPVEPIDCEVIQPYDLHWIRQTQQPKPSKLYHGSPYKLEIIEPHLARGSVEMRNDNLKGVYACTRRDDAIIYSLSINPDQSGQRSWFTSWESNQTSVILEKGSVNLEQEGYLYQLPSDSFRQIDQYQWISEVCVKPLSCEVIKPTDYDHLIKRKL